MNEQDETTEYKVTCIAPEGLGYGEGGISAKKRLEDPNDPLTPEIMDDVDTTITGADILVPIESDDDGCPDGRRAGRLLKGIQLLEKTYHRAKTFGGGLTMSVSSQIGLGRAKSGLRRLFRSESDELEAAGLNYGAHTHKHASGHKSGCGAVDEAPAIIANASVYGEQIAGTLGAIKGILAKDGIDANKNNIDEVRQNYRTYNSEHSDEGYSGKAVIEETALEKDKVVAELERDHLEVAIVINRVKGMTVDQELVRSVTGDVAQVFPIDLPRKLDIVNKRYADEDEGVKSKAVLSMLVYALSTAATLTDGSLRVYVIEPVEEKQKVAEWAMA